MNDAQQAEIANDITCQRLLDDREINFPIPFPFDDYDLLEDYLSYLDGSVPNLWHVPLTQAERAILDAWEEACAEGNQKQAECDVRTSGE